MVYHKHRCMSSEFNEDCYLKIRLFVLQAGTGIAELVALEISRQVVTSQVWLNWRNLLVTIVNW
jgi:hypothetical protein